MHKHFKTSSKHLHNAGSAQRSICAMLDHADLDDEPSVIAQIWHYADSASHGSGIAQCALRDDEVGADGIVHFCDVLKMC